MPQGMVVHAFLREHGSLSLLGCYTPGSGIPGTMFDFLEKKKDQNIFQRDCPSECISGGAFDCKVVALCTFPPAVYEGPDFPTSFWNLL